MPSTNELRVFISSTFRDLQEEREHLVKKIFPEIRSLCRKRGITFTEVDLRWGISDEQLALGQVIRACLEEVDKCRPYFIGITGERYGYIPSVLDIYKDPGLLQEFPWIEDAAAEEMSITEMEAYYAVLGEGLDKERCLDARFYFRRHRRGVDEERGEDEEWSRLEAYQSRIKEAGVSIEKFRDPVSLGEMIYDDLVEIIDRDFADAIPPTPLEIERSRHDAFSLSRRRAYIPNPAYLKRLNDHAKSDGPPLTIYAESGSGKSSLFAFWAEQFRRKNPDAHVIEHYVGIGATSTDHYAVIRHLCMEVKERFGREEEIPSDPKELESAFGAWLGYAEHELAKTGERMVLILDGLNQLQGKALELNWIPEVIDPSIRLIISSTIEGTLMKLRSRGWSELGMQALSEPEREAVVVRYLAEFHKSLNPEQISKIASDYKCGHPLFLKTVLEEIRMIGRHEELDRHIDHYLETTGTEDLFQRVLERMEEDHGPRAVRTILSLIGLSQHGLDERELSEISGVSRLKVTAITAGLDYHLVRKAGLLTFFHDYLRRAVEKRYLMEDRLVAEQRAFVVKYFREQELALRAAQEVMWQLRQGGEQETLAEYLSDLDVLQTLYSEENMYEVQSTWSELIDSGVDIERLYRASAETYLREEHSREQMYGSLYAVCRLLRKMSYLDTVVALAQEMIRVAEEMNDRRRVARAEVFLASTYWEQDSIDLAVEMADRLFVVLEEVNDKRSLGLLCNTRGLIHMRLGEYDFALEQYEKALTINQDIGEKRGLGAVLTNMGIVYGHQGEYDRALEQYEKALAIHQERGEKSGIGSVIRSMANLYSERGEYDRVLEQFEKALAIHQKLGEKRWIAAVLGSMGNFYLRRGEVDRALEHYEKAVEIYQGLGVKSGVALMIGNIGIVYHRNGDQSRALEHYERALAIHEDLGQKDNVGRILINIGEIYRDLGEFDRALSSYEKALDINKELGQRALVAGSVRHLGYLYMMKGEYDRALEFCKRAININEDLGLKPELVMVLINAGYLFGYRGEFKHALECMEKAWTISNEIGNKRLAVQTLHGFSNALLHLCQSEDELPEYLGSHAPELLSGIPDQTRQSVDWKEITRRRARTLVEESLQIEEELSDHQMLFNNRVLLARLDEADGKSELACQSLHELLEGTDEPEQQAECHYWLWTFDPSNEEDRSEALKVYSTLLERTPKQEYRDRINELNQGTASE